MLPRGPNMLAGMIPTFAPRGVVTPGQLGPIRRVPVSFRKRTAFTASSVGTPSVMQTTSPTPDAALSTMASPANGGGTKITDALAPVCATASATESNTGTPWASAPPRPGVTPATTLVPYARICSAWKPPSRPVMPWTRSRVSRSTRIAILRRRLLFSREADRGASGLLRIADRDQAGALQQGQPLGGAGAGHADDDRDLHLDAPGRLEHAARYLFAAAEATEDVDQDDLYVAIEEHDLQRLAHQVRLGATANVQEIGGPAAVAGHHVQRAHHQSGAVADDAHVAIQVDVGDAAAVGLRLDRVLLRLLLVAEQVLVPEERVVVHVEFGVGGD